MGDEDFGPLEKLATATRSSIRNASSLIPSESASLRRELGLLDLVFISILLVVVPDLFGTAVKMGPYQVALWLVAIAFFFIPQALIVTHLNRRMPMEGGLYEWARHAFGDGIGFLVAWNLWLYGMIYVASIGLVSTTYAAYAVGLDADQIASNKWLVLSVSVLFIGALMLLTHVGMRFGKWITNAGSVLTITTIAFLAAVPFLRHPTTSAGPYHPLALAAPPLTFYTLSVFTKMTFGALCGFEYAAIFAGESRNPRRHLTRAVLIAAPIIALLYIFGTSAILAFVPPDKVDVIGPIPQALSVAFGSASLAPRIVPAVILLLLTNYLSSFAFNFAANTRLPMCAGWDKLLPSWFTRLNPKYRTPINSILFLGGITIFASAAALIGVGGQEAFALLQIWTFTFYGFAYLALFTIPLFSTRTSIFHAPIWLRAMALSALVLTLLFVLLSVFPIIPVVNQHTYTIKTAAVLIGVNLCGLSLYLFRPRRQQIEQPEATLPTSAQIELS
jgi:amino acid transporter